MRNTSTTIPASEEGSGETVKSHLILNAVPLGTNRAIRRAQLLDMVPIPNTTLWEMEQRGEFPRRFYLTKRCAAWDLDEVQEWLRLRKIETTGKPPIVAPLPDANPKTRRRKSAR